MKKLLSVIFVIFLFSFLSCNKNDPTKALTLAEMAGIYNGAGVTVPVTSIGSITFGVGGAKWK